MSISCTLYSLKKKEHKNNLIEVNLHNNLHDPSNVRTTIQNSQFQH